MFCLKPEDGLEINSGQPSTFVQKWFSVLRQIQVNPDTVIEV